MKLDPRHLEILAAIVDAGGATEAADLLGKSQPSLSRTMSNLEARICEPLFVPGKRPLQPTDLGLMLARQGRQIREATLAAELELERRTNGQSGIIRVGGSPFFMDGVIASRIARFQSQFPEIRVDQVYAYTADLIRQLENGQLDIAICPVRTNNLPKTMTSKVLLPGKNVIVCRQAHPLARKPDLTINDIGNSSWIAPPAGSPLFRDLQDALTTLGQNDVKIAFSGGSLSSILNMIQESDALTILPYSVVFTMQRQYGLHALDINIQHPDRNLVLLRKSNEKSPIIVRRFERNIIEVFEELASSIMREGKANPPLQNTGRSN